MTTHDDFRSLCSEILDLLDYNIPQDDRPTCWDPWRNRARALCNQSPTLLTPSSGYERGDGSMDGAQMVDGEWWHPVWGCDSLSHVIDQANYLLVNKKQ